MKFASLRTVPHMIVVFDTHVQNDDISSNFFSFFQNSDFLGFSKFINKCQKEILRFAPPSSHLCDFFLKVWFNNRSNIKLKLLVILIVSVLLILHKHIKSPDHNEAIRSCSKHKFFTFD